MITKANEPIYQKANGTYVMTRAETGDLNYWCGFPDDPDGCHAEVTAYLLDHPEALVPEPVPPPPAEAELAARRVAEARAYLASTDWVIAKLGETQMTGQDIAPLVAKYQNVLDARVAARETINGGEA